MTSTTLHSRSIAARLQARILSFVVNPLGWRQHAKIRISAVKSSPRVQLTRRWYLQATREDVSADLSLQTDRLGRRRCRILNLEGFDRTEVRESSAYAAARRWVETGDDSILKAIRA